jgi:large subunit ribosomal protein L31
LAPCCAIGRGLSLANVFLCENPKLSEKYLGWAWAAIATARKSMKEGIHPNYREVCFLDLSNGFKFVTRSCANTKEKITLEDGRELPLYKLDTSSESHPFYTGTQKSVDNMGGRVERFRNRFGKSALAK